MQPDLMMVDSPMAGIHYARRQQGRHGAGQNLTGSGRLIDSLRETAVTMLDAVEAGALGGTRGGAGSGRDPSELLVDDRPLSSRLGGFTNSYRSLSSLQNLHQISHTNQQMINEATALVEKGEATAEVRVCLFVLFSNVQTFHRLDKLRDNRMTDYIACS
jgi:hypothetical protein